ncbi:hypothetical protein EV11_0984 [Prochlorococcus sp. SS52]|uniref:Uncharacterized protein n=1 Tax=Prochlorococcus marinus (strain SARG / CCMP1375 / SS120) TaxID=167539 RepID=Q7V9J1_PROMA|nr:Predicted protein [Prochlorococcus marinus subsp. marinus str. CCMP1375]KGG10620.1 hypothetical protein EV04_1579 [Prochlorococcus marinus str. LG]KGG19914.1 hypothetical protein EV08_1228 [Prochlorococcus marinus str. SS2]KGG23866.1 hypothetical protein EV09_0468 [Prochlorococcus marinus str. SS35]KGG31874.1 hypothetical protein EV10_1973 [Prochlorococcus marinus str. SS51]KGG35961.1 hypothetical protein EV11_0984 [Prochlorococcus sp. SS52]
MKRPIIFSLIKTTCGREKYNQLVQKKDLIGQIRLIWFISIATIKDWNIKSID